MRYMAAQLGSPIRIVALSVSVANARDIGNWLGCTAHNTFNFHPASRPQPLELHVQGFNINYADSRLDAMERPMCVVFF